MNDLHAARLVAELCLAEDRPLADEVRPFSKGAADAAAAGDLRRAFTELRVDPHLARLGQVRPAALRRASEYLAQLPSAAAVRVPLVQTAIWFLFVALIQASVLTVTTLRVLPVVAKISADHDLAWATWSGWSATALAFGGLAFAVGAVLGARWPQWLPGWGRSLHQAREAAMTAALVETKPPADVLAAWLRGSASLQRAPTAPHAADLTALAQSRASGAEQQMQRFVIIYRYAGFALLTAVALGLTLDVYTGCAGLWRLR